MARLAIPIPALGFLPPQEGHGFAMHDEADDARRELGLLSLSVDPVCPRESFETAGDGARREMDLLSLSPEARPVADPRDELDFFSLTTRGL